MAILILMGANNFKTLTFGAGPYFKSGFGGNEFRAHGFNK